MAGWAVSEMESNSYLVLMSRDRYGTPLLRRSLTMPWGRRPVTDTA